jgi:hypothetical protein
MGDSQGAAPSACVGLSPPAPGHIGAALGEMTANRRMQSSERGVAAKEGSHLHISHLPLGGVFLAAAIRGDGGGAIGRSQTPDQVCECPCGAGGTVVLCDPKKERRSSASWSGTGAL